MTCRCLLHEGEEEVRESPAGLSRIDCCPARTADNEDSVSRSETGGPGPLANLPAPKALSPPLESTPASGTTSPLIRKRCSSLAKRCHFRITWPHQYRERKFPGHHAVCVWGSGSSQAPSCSRGGKSNSYCFSLALPEHIPLHPMPRRSRKVEHGRLHSPA